MSFTSFKSIFDLLNPFKSIHFLEEAHSLAKLIGGYGPPDERRREVISFVILFIFLSVQVILLVYRAFTPETSEWHNLITLNVFGLSRMPVLFNLEALSLPMTTFFYYYIYFFRASKEYCFEIVDQVVYRGHKSFVFKSKSQFDRAMLHVLQGYLPFLLFVNVMGIGIYMIIFYRIVTYPDRTMFEILTAVLIYHFFVWAALMQMHVIRIGCIVAPFIFVASWIFFIRLDELRRVLLERPLNRYSLSRLLLYQRENVRSLEYLFSLNRLYGPMLFAFLITHVPFSGALLTTLLVRRPHLVSAICCVTAIAGQASGLVLFHWVAALFTRRIHAPMLRIMAINIQIRNVTLYNRIKMAHTIAAFHTFEPYGITYASFGLVTMLAFAKFLFLYSEFMYFNLSHMN